jgi:hypothetical protein
MSNETSEVLTSGGILSMEYSLVNGSLFLLVCEKNNIIKMYLDYSTTDSSADLNLIKILNSSVDLLNHELSSYKKFDIIPPIPNTGHRQSVNDLVMASSAFTTNQVDFEKITSNII